MRGGRKSPDDCAQGDEQLGAGVDVLIAEEAELGFGIEFDRADAEFSLRAYVHSQAVSGHHFGAAGIIVIGVVDEQTGAVLDELGERAGPGDSGSNVGGVAIVEARRRTARALMVRLAANSGSGARPDPVEKSAVKRDVVIDVAERSGLVFAIGRLRVGLEVQHRAVNRDGAGEIVGGVLQIDHYPPGEHRKRDGQPLGARDFPGQIARPENNAFAVGKIEIGADVAGGEQAAAGNDDRAFAGDGASGFQIGDANRLPLESGCLQLQHIARLGFGDVGYITGKWMESAGGGVIAEEIHIGRAVVAAIEKNVRSDDRLRLIPAGDF